VNVAVIGMTPLGIVTGACLSNFGHVVRCFDADENKIALLNKNERVLDEPGLEEVIALGIESDRLSFTTDMAEAVRMSLCLFVTVSGDRVLDTARALGEVIRDVKAFRIVAIKTVVPPGTSRVVSDAIANAIDGRWPPVDVVYNPSRLRAGRAVEDFIAPDIVIIGADDPRTTTLVLELYKNVVGGRVVLATMGAQEAENYRR